MLQFPLQLPLMRNLSAQEKLAFVPNYDESKVPQYKLPDPLLDQNAVAVKDSSAWLQRRAEILKLFQEHVFGQSPEAIEVKSQLVSHTDEALDGTAVRREFDLTLSRNGHSLTLGLIVYTPRGKSNVPTFLGLNFQGNHALENDPAIRITQSWMRDRKDDTVKENRATKQGRGVDSRDWPVATIVGRGYGLASVYYGDIDPDFDDGFQNGIHPLFKDWSETLEAGQRWGSIAAWAYGLSRTLDFLQTDQLVDANRVAVIGHSRLGKTALWAGAMDQRFKLVISNNSGCGGAALSRRAYGETVGRINRAFPHWFCLNHRQYNENEQALPVDHHQLIALMAPRAVYVASASEDKWADPKGEFLSCVHADPVYRLLGVSGLWDARQPTKYDWDQQPKLPAIDQPIQQGKIGYHIRTGPHAMLPVDWQHYLDFADKHL